jgi:hypothetical protein
MRKTKVRRSGRIVFYMYMILGLLWYVLTISAFGSFKKSLVLSLLEAKPCFFMYIWSPLKKKIDLLISMILIRVWKMKRNGKTGINSETQRNEKKNQETKRNNLRNETIRKETKKKLPRQTKLWYPRSNTENYIENNNSKNNNL